jgi:hypothetical protein
MRNSSVVFHLSSLETSSNSFTTSVSYRGEHRKKLTKMKKKIALESLETASCLSHSLSLALPHSLTTSLRQRHMHANIYIHIYMYMQIYMYAYIFYTHLHVILLNHIHKMRVDGSPECIYVCVYIYTYSERESVHITKMRVDSSPYMQLK